MIMSVHRRSNYLDEGKKLQPTQFQLLTARKKISYRCFLPDLAEFNILSLRKAKTSTSLIIIIQRSNNPSFGIQSCIKRVSGNREPLTPHLAQNIYYYYVSFSELYSFINLGTSSAFSFTIFTSLTFFFLKAL